MTTRDFANRKGISHSKVKKMAPYLVGAVKCPKCKCWIIPDNAKPIYIPDKRKYSDVALKLLSYVKDEIERASYEEKVAKKLRLDVEILREKGDRLNKKLEQAASHRYLKKPKTEVKSDKLLKIENSLLALKVFGGITKTDIPFEVPEDEAKLADLEFVFNSEHEGIKEPDYEKEAAELMKLYTKEQTGQRIKELTAKLDELDEESDEYEATLRQIRDLQNPGF